MLASVRDDKAAILRFAGHELDRSRFELRRAGEPVPIEPQALDVLAYLAMHHDRVVTREELLDHVWGDRFVSASAVSTRIKDARRAVGDDGELQAVIKTVHGRGFRLVCDVEEVTDEASPDAVAALPGRSLRRMASTFVGRDEELDSLSELLSRARLLTLCGPGGIGKTRLALELASRVSRRYADGARLLELAELPDGADVVATVAAAAGVQQRPGTELVDRVVDALAGRHVLLVVDNCEHVAGSAATLVRRLVEATGGVDVLATGRHPLHLDGEQVWPVRPLPWSTAGSSAAIQLFLDRAASLDRTGWVDSLDLAQVERVCEMVDGIPLCIELAASRARHVGLGALLDELGDAIPLVAIGRADRHHSAQSVIAWSHDRLPQEPRVLFDRVSLFAGPFEASAAARLAGAEDERAAADLLSVLVDRSMVTVDHRGLAARYRVLAPLRDFGRHQLEQSADNDVVHRRHLEWVVSGASAADEALRGPAGAAAMITLEGLVPELPRARLTVAAHDDATAKEELARALLVFGQEQGRVELLMPQPLDADAAPVCQAAAAVAGWQLGDIDAATAGAQRAVDRATHVRDAALARLSLAGVCQVRGDHERAVQLGREMSDLAVRGDDPLLGTMAHVVQALSCAALGRTADAVREAERSAGIAQQSGSPLASGWAAYAQGEARLERDPGQALDYLERARALGRSAGSRLLTGVAGLSWVSLRARSTTDEESLAGFTEIIDHWARAGTAVHQWTTLRNLVQVLAQRGADEDAARLHSALTASPRGAAPQGAEAARLADEMRRVEARLGPQRFSELTADGARWSDAEVVARSRAACRVGAGAIPPD